MEQADDQSGKRKTWLIIFVVTLFVLAILWSVDPSIFYVLLGLAAFSFYKILAHRKRMEDDYEPSYRETYQHRKPSFWKDVKKLFDNPGTGQTHSREKTSRLVSLIIAGSVGLVFFLIILSALFSNDTQGSREYRQQASDLYDRQEYDSAAYFYDEAIKDDPENAELYLARGNAFLNGNKTDSAMIEYDRALKLHPSYKEAYYNKGLVYYNRKQYRNSINEVKKAMQVDPSYTDGMLLIGDDFYNSSQLDSAMVWYEDAYARGYRSAALSHIMAYVYDTKGNTQKAIPFYKEAIAYDTTRTEIYTRLGELVGGEEGNQYRQKAAQYPFK